MSRDSIELSVSCNPVVSSSRLFWACVNPTWSVNDGASQESGGSCVDCVVALTLDDDAAEDAARAGALCGSMLKIARGLLIPAETRGGS